VPSQSYFFPCLAGGIDEIIAATQGGVRPYRPGAIAAGKEGGGKARLRFGIIGLHF